MARFGAYEGPKSQMLMILWAVLMSICLIVVSTVAR